MKKAEDWLRGNSVVITIEDEGGGVDAVSLNDALKATHIAHNDAVKKWTLWCFNYFTPFESTICKIWGGTQSGFGGRYYCEDNHFTQHLIEKWQSFENRGDASMLYFYCELDINCRKQLVDWVLDNYKG